MSKHSDIRRYALRFAGASAAAVALFAMATAVPNFGLGTQVTSSGAPLKQSSLQLLLSQWEQFRNQHGSGTGLMGRGQTGGSGQIGSGGQSGTGNQHFRDIQPPIFQGKYDGDVPRILDDPHATMILENRSTVEYLGTIDTRTFFPRVDVSISQRGIQPFHPRLRPDMNQSRMVGVVPPMDQPGVIQPPSAGRIRVENEFPGIGATGLAPPDPHMAVGPEFVVQVVNSRVAFYRKDNGQPTFAQNLNGNAFFQGIGVTSNFTFDPKVVYDPYEERFYMIILEAFGADDVSTVLLAVSDDADPNGVWSRYRINSKITVNSVDYWLDYPQLGFSQEGVVITGNMFPFAAGPPIGSILLPIRKDNLFAQESGAFDIPQIGSPQFTMQVANGFSTTNTVYTIARAPGANLAITALTDFQPDNTPTVTVTTVGIPPTQAAPAFAPTATGGSIDTINDRLMDAFILGQNLLATETVRTGENRAGVAWYEFELNDFPNAAPTLLQAGVVALPNGDHGLMPAIAKNGIGDVSLIFTRTGPNRQPEAVISTRTIDDPLGFMSAPAILAESPGNATTVGSRWGDYAQAVVDPVDFITFWGTSHLQQSSGMGAWTTTIGAWTVSEGADSEEANALNPTVLAGNYVSGNAASLVEEDADRFIVNSVLTPDLGWVATVRFDFQFVEDLSGLRGVELETVGTSVGPDVTGTIFFFNRQTGRYDFIRSFRVTDVEGIKRVGGLPVSALGPYLTEGGEITAAIRYHNPYRRTGEPIQPFQMVLDLVKMRSITQNILPF